MPTIRKKEKTRIKKCSACGARNFQGTRECTKCGYEFSSTSKPSIWSKLLKLITGNG